MEKLRSSGLTIEDEETCCRVLADIGYFPVVNGYQSFFRDPTLTTGHNRLVSSSLRYRLSLADGTTKDY